MTIPNVIDYGQYQITDYYPRCMYCGWYVPSGTAHLYCAYGRPGTTLPPQPTICGVIANAGAKGEALACAFVPNHAGAHSWATLPTFTAPTAADPEPACAGDTPGEWA